MSDPKTLLPELLPAPQLESGTSPRERVNERARQLLERFRDVGALAGAAFLGVHCGGGIGGGYGVVDPAPPPATSCVNPDPKVDPFATLMAHATFDSTPAALPRVVLHLTARVGGLRIDAVRVTGGTLVAVDDRDASSIYSPTLRVTLAPETATSILTVEVDFNCVSARTTRRYRIAYHLPTSNSTLIVELLPVQP